MIEISYVEQNGARHRVEVFDGQTLMEGAVLNGLPGIEGMCGGMLSCGTCQCYIDEAWLDRLAPPQPAELDMLEALDGRRSNSRLGCQVRVTPELAGLVVYLPEPR